VNGPTAGRPETPRLCYLSWFATGDWSNPPKRQAWMTWSDPMPSISTQGVLGGLQVKDACWRDWKDKVKYKQMALVLKAPM